MKRVVIYPKDVMCLTGKSERSSRELLKKIKASLNKKERHLVSVHEFCEYLGLNVEHIISVMK